MSVPLALWIAYSRFMEDSKNTKGRIGWGAQADWDQTIDLLKKYRDLKTDQPWTTFHTNEFVAQK